MPCEERVPLAVKALAGPIRAFQSTLGLTADEIARDLRSRRSTWDGTLERVRAELGPLAAGRIDVAQFATRFANHQAHDPAAIAVAQRALDALTALRARGEGLAVVEVGPGASLYETVDRALADIGRAFSAARLVAAVRAGRRVPDGDDAGPAPLPFSRWTRQERRVAPPLVVGVHGRDLRAAGLAEFLDGRQKLVLVVEGECAPAPLVRLIAPGTFVVQAADAAPLARLAAWDGPGIAALVPESAARFVHDPGAGAPRLTIETMPDRIPRKTIAGLSAAQQADELELLRSLAARAATVETGGAQPAGSASDPAEKLATWLLSQVDLASLG